MNCRNKYEIFKEDDYRAFGGNLFSVSAIFPPEMLDGHTISKAELMCGDLFFEFENPVFPLEFTPTANQTKELKHINTCFLKVYDENNYGITCDGQLQFIAREKAVYNNVQG